MTSLGHDASPQPPSETNTTPRLPIRRGRLVVTLIAAACFAGLFAAGSAEAFLSVAPLDNSTIAASTAAGGVKITHDGGKTWTVLKMPEKFKVVRGPWLVGNGRTVFVLRMESDHFYTPKHEHFYRSGDGGDTWQPVVGLPSGTDVEAPNSVIGDPVSGKDVWLCSGHGAPRHSTDGGMTWSSLKHPPTHNCWGLTIQPERSDHRAILVKNAGRWMRSADGGSAWRSVGAAETLSIGEGGLAFSIAHPTIAVRLFATRSVRGTQLQRSTDAGRTWKPIRPDLHSVGPCAAHGHYASVPCLYDTAARLVYGAGRFVWGPIGRDSGHQSVYYASADGRRWTRFGGPSSIQPYRAPMAFPNAGDENVIATAGAILQPAWRLNAGSSRWLKTPKSGLASRSR
jgi:hypothetical protein